MIKRELAAKILGLAKKFPAVAILGPRQSGKTTLCKSIFPDYKYISLEDLDTRTYAIEDPRGFLAQYDHKIIFDEVQRAPDLFSYLQTQIDKSNKNGQFILTGSNNFLLSNALSQSLAGRVAIETLLPLSLKEIQKSKYQQSDLDTQLFMGLYPRIFDQDIPPTDWYPNYIKTYIERDVRLIKNITNLNNFRKFIALCAGRAGQILNLSSLGNDCGQNYNTIKEWISLLESSYLIFLLQPFYKNFNKRVIKMPKLYFYDTGLLCSLLHIKTPEQLRNHYLKGAIFESFVLSEIIKNRQNKGIDPNLFFWRDSHGNEIDVLIETEKETKAIEIKSGQTISLDYWKGLKFWHELTQNDPQNSMIVYGGNESQKRTGAKVFCWKEVSDL